MNKKAEELKKEFFKRKMELDKNSQGMIYDIYIEKLMGILIDFFIEKAILERGNE